MGTMGKEASSRINSELRLMNSIKQIFKHSFLYPRYRDYIQRMRQAKEMRNWLEGDKKTPLPHLEKQKFLLALKGAHDCTTFVETGTYAGDMTGVMARHFKQVHSIELSEFHHQTAKLRFRGRTNIHLHLGDSSQVLGKIIPGLDGKVLFWLDGHYSGESTARGNLDTPIVHELQVVLQAKTGYLPVVAIDDARCFDGTGDYPSVDQLSKMVAALCPSASFDIKHDIIMVIPRPT